MAEQFAMYVIGMNEHQNKRALKSIYMLFRALSKSIKDQKRLSRSCSQVSMALM